MSETLSTMLEKKALLIDVRTKAEFSQGSAKNAINIPLQELPSRLSEVGDKNKPVVVFCASGGRSASARNFLLEQGFKEVLNAGGVMNVISAQS